MQLCIHPNIFFWLLLLCFSSLFVFVFLICRVNSQGNPVRGPPRSLKLLFNSFFDFFSKSWNKTKIFLFFKRGKEMIWNLKAKHFPSLVLISINSLGEAYIGNWCTAYKNVDFRSVISSSYPRKQQLLLPVLFFFSLLFVSFLSFSSDQTDFFFTQFSHPSRAVFRKLVAQTIESFDQNNGGKWVEPKNTSRTIGYR